MGNQLCGEKLWFSVQVQNRLPVSYSISWFFKLKHLHMLSSELIPPKQMLVIELEELQLTNRKHL